jgi:CrcB protein
MLVSVGSAVGGLARWGVGELCGWLLGKRFPYGTFLINISGSFFIGWFLTVLSERVIPEDSWLQAEDLRLLIAVGFTGTYTTFSTFEYETHTLLKDDGLAAVTYLLGSVFLGLLAVRCGILLAHWR